MENRQGEGKNSVGNVEAKELISMTHGHELSGGNVGGRGWPGWSGVKGGTWDNCNSTVNKYIKKKVSGYKVNLQKSVALLYANNKQKVKKTILFTIAPTRIKYLGINLTKDIKDLSMENSKTLKKIQINGSTYCVHG